CHYLVTSIDTSSTTNTFQLSTISNIDSSRTNHHTLITIYTVTFSSRFSIFVSSILSSTIFTFTSYIIVSNDDGFLIDQCTLQTTVRTYKYANLFPEPCKNKVE